MKAFSLQGRSCIAKELDEVKMIERNVRVRSAFVPHDLRQPLRGAEEGPLCGLAAAVKDMYDIVGERAGGGNPDWLAVARPATANASAVQKILDAGATVIGKTICDEFFFSLIGANPHYGTPLNPKAPTRVPGGSSSGSASATASGACDFALGSDTGGSVRVPASFCGVYGIRPTHGRVDLTGAMPMAPSLDVCGWFASGPGVLRRVGDVLLDQRRRSIPIERMIVLDDAFAQAEPDCRNVLDAAIAAMKPELPPLRNDTAAMERFDSWSESFRLLQGREVWTVYGDFVTQRSPAIAPDVRERLRLASLVTDEEVAGANEVRRRVRERLSELVQPGTVLVMPTAPSVAPLIDSTSAQLLEFRTRLLRLTCIASLTGLPQVTLPVGTISGAPVGLSFMAWHGGDEALLDLTIRLSRHCGVELD
jgi:amidase